MCTMCSVTLQQRHVSEIGLLLAVSYLDPLCPMCIMCSVTLQQRHVSEIGLLLAVLLGPFVSNVYNVLRNFAAETC